MAQRKQWTAHGLSGHPLYTRWQDMVRRCSNPNDKRFPWYGAKGIKVCSEWLEDPVAFIEWCLQEGWVPGKEIDKDIKIPGSKVYSPQTCSIVDHRQNMLPVVGRQSGRRTAKLKLSLKDVADILSKKDSGVTSKVLATTYGVSVSTINRLYRQI